MKFQALIALFLENEWQAVVVEENAAHLTITDKGEVFNAFFVLTTIEGEEYLHYKYVINNIAFGGILKKVQIATTFWDVDSQRRYIAQDWVIKNQCEKVPPQYKPAFWVNRVQVCEFCGNEPAEPRITICKSCVQKQVDDLFTTTFSIKK